MNAHMQQKQANNKKKRIKNTQEVTPHRINACKNCTTEATDPTNKHMTTATNKLKFRYPNSCLI